MVCGARLFLLAVVLGFLPGPASAGRRTGKKALKRPKSNPLMHESQSLESAFSPEECARIIAASAELGKTKAGIDGHGLSSETRTTTNMWLPADTFSWVYDRVIKLAKETNKKTWKFVGLRRAERIQIRYALQQPAAHEPAAGAAAASF